MNDLNIVYTVDDSYLPLVSISLSSIRANNKGLITFFISTEKDDKTENWKKLYEFHNNIDTKIKFLDCRKYDTIFESKRLNKWGSKSYFTYWRLVAFDLLSCDFAWFIDADILCLSEIIAPNLGNRICGLVLDSAHSFYNKQIGINKEDYFFNTGVIYTNINEWKKKQSTKKLINYIQENKSKLIMADQDVFSIVMSEESIAINPKYNYFVGYDYYGIENSYKMYSLNKKKYYQIEDIYKAQNEVIFYHCLKGVFGRPWENNNFSPIKEEYEKYEKMSAFKSFRKKRTISLIEKLELKLEKLPRKIYNKMHNFAIVMSILIKKYL